MNTLSEASLISALNWRYATKSYDAVKKISAATWNALTEALVLSPSSYGLQPYRFLVVNDPAVRAQLLPHAWGQRQVVDASHLVVFTARTGFTAEEVDKFIELTAKTRGIPAEALKGYRDMMVGDLVKGPRAAIVDQWAARQVYIALGNLLTSAAVLGVDATPMEGFLPSEFDKVLGLPGTGYTAVVIAALGYRAADDKYAAAPKVRFAANELVKTV